MVNDKQTETLPELLPGIARLHKDVTRESRDQALTRPATMEGTLNQLEDVVLELKPRERARSG
jgi:hypothetical protein